jgi:hypothetical protein
MCCKKLVLSVLGIASPFYLQKLLGYRLSQSYTRVSSTFWLPLPFAINSMVGFRLDSLPMTIRGTASVCPAKAFRELAPLVGTYQYCNTINMCCLELLQNLLKGSDAVNLAGSCYFTIGVDSAAEFSIVTGT